MFIYTHKLKIFTLVYCNSLQIHVKLEKGANAAHQIENMLLRDIEPEQEE